MRETDQENRIKPVSWVGSSQEDLKEFPTEVQRTIGYALFVAQVGKKHQKTKPLKGLPGVLEIRLNIQAVLIGQSTQPKLTTLFMCCTLFKRSQREEQEPQRRKSNE